jgi:hypothetical protein
MRNLKSILIFISVLLLVWHTQSKKYNLLVNGDFSEPRLSKFTDSPVIDGIISWVEKQFLGRPETT